MQQRSIHFCLKQATPSVWAEKGMLINDSYTSRWGYAALR